MSHAKPERKRKSHQSMLLDKVVVVQIITNDARMDIHHHCSHNKRVRVLRREKNSLFFAPVGVSL
jgi:hypothetical protein